MGIEFSDWVENIVGKEEIARYEQFFLFPQCFPMLSVVDVLKWLSMEERVKLYMHFTSVLFACGCYLTFNSFPNNKF